MEGEAVAKSKVYGYVKYNRKKIVALLCPSCVFPYELLRINAPKFGLVEITEVGTSICKRCRKEF